MYVYVLRSIRNPQRWYVDSTKNLKDRLRQHNRGESEYTKALRPWGLETAFWFSGEQKAIAFERYLKTQSGRAFRKNFFNFTRNGVGGLAPP